MAKFKNVSGRDLSLIRPAGHPDSHLVEADGDVTVPGEVTATTADAYIVGEGAKARAFSRQLFELVEEPSKTPQLAAPQSEKDQVKKKEGERP